MTTTAFSQATVTVSAPPGHMTASVRIAGDVDMVVEPALKEAVDRLGAAAPHTVEVDLAGVTFGGSALANFFAQMHCAIPDGASIVVHGVSRGVRHVLEVTGIDQLVTLRGDLPIPHARPGTDRR